MARFYEILFISALLSLTASALQVLATYEDLSADDYVDVASLGDYDGLYYTAICKVSKQSYVFIQSILADTNSHVPKPWSTWASRRLSRVLFPSLESM